MLEARTGVGTAAALGAVAGTAFLVVDGLGPGGEAEVPVATATPAPRAVEGGLFRPAGFFEDVVGGRAVPTTTRRHVVRGEKFLARFDWTPDGAAGDTYLGDIALERVRGGRDRACAALAGGAATCTAGHDDSVVGSYEMPADGAFLDPVHRAAPIRFDSDEPVVRGVTYFRADGVAVSVLLCNCSASEGVVLADEPPVSVEDLTRVVSDDSWSRGR